MPYMIVKSGISCSYALISACAVAGFQTDPAPNPTGCFCAKRPLGRLVIANCIEFQQNSRAKAIASGGMDSGRMPLSDLSEAVTSAQALN